MMQVLKIIFVQANGWSCPSLLPLSGDDMLPDLFMRLVTRKIIISFSLKMRFWLRVNA